MCSEILIAVPTLWICKGALLTVLQNKLAIQQARSVRPPLSLMKNCHDKKSRVSMDDARGAVFVFSDRCFSKWFETVLLIFVHSPPPPPDRSDLDGIAVAGPRARRRWVAKRESGGGKSRTFLLCRGSGVLLACEAGG